MRFNRRDTNEAEIVTALQRVGCMVDYVERRPYDLVVSRCGVNYLLECKERKGSLTDSQVKFRQTWNGPYFVVRSVRDALEAVGIGGRELGPVPGPIPPK